MHDFIERLRAKPEHQRRQIAFATSGAVTGLIAVMWFGAVVASGTLALESSSDGDRAVAEAPRYDETFAEGQNRFSELFAAVGAVGNATSTDSLVIVETSSSSTIAPPQSPERRTVIPF